MASIWDLPPSPTIAPPAGAVTHPCAVDACPGIVFKQGDIWACGTCHTAYSIDNQDEE